MDTPSAAPPLLNHDIRECRRLLEDMIRALVDKPEEVSIDLVTGRQAVIYEVSVGAEDIRRVIGRKGRTADALRELMTNLGSKAGRRFLLEIVEPQNRHRPRVGGVEPEN